jgi:hypothetical protein
VINRLQRDRVNPTNAKETIRSARSSRRGEQAQKLALPNADAIQLHLNETPRCVADSAHAVLLIDRAG